MKLFVRIVTVIFMLGFLAGCASTPRVRVLWPFPPQTPRLEFMGVYYSQYDFNRNEGKRSLSEILGQDDAMKFYFPIGVASDSKGRVYISDPGAENVFIYDFQRKKVSYLFKKPLGKPYKMTIDKQGRLYIAINDSHNVLVFASDGSPLFNFGADHLAKPGGIAVDEVRKRIYVSDIKRGRVEIFDLDGKYLKEFGGVGQRPGQMATPSDLALDSQGNIYVTEMLNARVQVFTPEGKSKLVFGHRSDQVDGFEMPKGIALDSQDNVYITDARKGALLIYNKEGHLLLYTGLGAQSGKVLGFGSPNGIFIDKNDRIYIADSLNKRFAVWQFLNEKYLSEHPLSEADLKVYKQMKQKNKRK